FPDKRLPAGGYLVVFASEKDRGGQGKQLHTNFRIDAAGEFLALVKPDGVSVAWQFGPGPGALGDQRFDITYGIEGAALTAGGDLSIAPRVYFTSATPGAVNGVGLAELVQEPDLSVRHGLYSNPFDVEISTATPGATIRYTLNGSTPSLTNGVNYTGPIHVASTTTLRAAAFKTGGVPSETVTRTYLFLADVVQQSPAGQAPAGWPSAPVSSQIFNYGMDPDIVNHPEYGPQLIEALQAIPSLSIVTDLPNLFDPATGIYVNGTENGRQWERPISIELIDPDGGPGTVASAGLRIRGQTSSLPQNSRHSLRVFFRDEYGDDRLQFPLFGAEGVDEFDSFDLRLDHLYSWSFATYDNATFLRDAFSPDTQRDMGQPYLRSRFHHVYLNGQYWGMYQLQERA
ncbi:MAG: chitobiase/beta-hexosaminidase C-terminal domain-containing protein, partial [Pirellulales bacterium]